MSLVVDVHTHMYPPAYLSLLRSRRSTPYVYDPPDGADPRLIILTSDDDSSRPQAFRGRPIDASYFSWDEKRKFMDRHGINISVVSLANPWLDFLHDQEAADWAVKVNDDLNQSCDVFNSQGQHGKACKLYGFGTLPLGATAQEITSEIRRLKSLKNIKGIVMGTTGLGKGLDDRSMRPIWQALQETNTIVFLHPHYGLPDAAFGGEDTVARSGHVLPLALGFPLETTIALTRMFLVGVFDDFPRLQMLLAHSGGTLPFLAGRIQSCVEHEREFIANGGKKQGPQKSIWDVLHSNIYLDAVIYGDVGLKAAIQAAGSVDRVLFGTDHPFFPALNPTQEKWPSVTSNYAAISTAFGDDSESAKAVLGGNALRILSLDA